MDCLLYLIRHAATANNLADPPLLQGRKMDPELSEAGREQARRTAQLLAPLPIARIVASPLLRSRETAQLIAAAQTHAREIEILEELAEVDVGDWEGRSWIEIAESDPEAYRRFMEDPGQHGYAGGENFLQVQQRVTPALQRLLAENPGRQLVVVGHNAVNRSFLAKLLGLPLKDVRRVRQDNCGVNLVRYRQGRSELITFNSALHLRQRDAHQ